MEMSDDRTELDLTALAASGMQNLPERLLKQRAFLPVDMRHLRRQAALDEHVVEDDTVMLD